MDSYKYFAFISYSHTDKKAAKKPYRRLRWYRLPVALAKGRDEGGEPLPKRVTPIYVDGEEMANNSVRKGMSSGLDRSRFLIVVCSPHSARSECVNMEV